MFAFKKIVSLFLFPVALLGFFLAVSVALLWVKGGGKWAAWGRSLVTLAAILFWVLGSNWCADTLLRPLLGAYAPVEVSQLRRERGEDWAPDYLVVLAAGHSCDARTPPGLRLGWRSLSRVHQAFQLHRSFPRTPVICTGGRLHPGCDPISRDMAAALMAWGVPQDLLITEEQSRDTDDHVRYLGERLQGKTFLLITSATHMPRSMALFRHGGLDPIAAPAREWELEVRGGGGGWRGLIPNSGNFARVEAAAYEYMGLLWAKLSGLL